MSATPDLTKKDTCTDRSHMTAFLAYNSVPLESSYP